MNGIGTLRTIRLPRSPGSLIIKILVAQSRDAHSLVYRLAKPESLVGGRNSLWEY